MEIYYNNRQRFFFFFENSELLGNLLKVVRFNYYGLPQDKIFSNIWLFAKFYDNLTVFNLTYISIFLYFKIQYLTIQDFS